MRITHLGHACVLVETPTARLLVDPGTFSTGWQELTDLDAVLITHAHADHVAVDQLPALLEANDGALLRVEPELAAQLRDAGIGDLADLAPLHPDGSVEVGGVVVEAVGGRHAVIHPELPVIGNVGLLVRAEGEPTLFHPGDSYATTPAGVDVLALPLSAPWATSAMVVDFLRAAAPTTSAFTIHDALLAPVGRSVYLRNLATLVEGTPVRDAGAGDVLEL